MLFTAASAPRLAILSQRDACLGKIHVTSFDTLIQEEDSVEVSTARVERNEGTASDVDVATHNALTK